MGNNHPNNNNIGDGNNYSKTTINNNNTTTNSIKRFTKKDSKLKMTKIFGGLRSQSTDNEIINSIKIKNKNYYSFTQSAQQSIEDINEQNINSSKKENNKINLNSSNLPRIEINGILNENEKSTIKSENIKNKINDQRRESDYSIIPLYFKNKAQKVDSRKITAKKRLERGQTTGSEDNSLQNTKKSSFSKRTLAKSLDVNNHNNTEILFEMKPLSSSLNYSQKQQKRLGSVGNVFGLISKSNNCSSFSSSNINFNILNLQQSEAIQKSWLLANEKIRLFAGSDRNFAFFTFDRIFERLPELKPLFGISPNISLFEMDEIQLDQHSFFRHVRIFNNILDLAVRNSAELEIEMFPVLFAYGQRHYRANIIEQFNEKTIRLFCSQIVGTLCDLLDKKLSNFDQEAWIEMVTYLGRALLSGFEHERQKRKKIIKK